LRLAFIARLCAILGVLGGCVGACANPAVATTSHPAWTISPSGTRQALDDVACLSATRCEAVGVAGTILGTVNGGRSWHAQHAGTKADVYRIDCVAPSTCYAIARPSTILVTHNGGATWRARRLNIPGVGSQTTVPGCNLGSLTPALEEPCETGLLDISCASGWVCTAVATAPVVYLAAGQPSPRGAPPGSTIWVTRNGGTTWASQRIPLALTCTSGDCGTSVFRYPLTWVSCQHSGLCRTGGRLFLGCGHCGFLDTVFSSTGPAAPWKLLCNGAHTDCSSEFSPETVRCPTSSVCYGIYSANPFAGSDARSQVFRSVNGASTWPFSDTGTTVLRHDIACPSARQCYTAGDGGSITRTTNGSRFTADPSPTKTDLFGVSCPSTSACYAVGDDGTILVR
jgi:photosystem II stability/assembly factor-like uncharacterized protein